MCLVVSKVLSGIPIDSLNPEKRYRKNRVRYERDKSKINTKFCQAENLRTNIIFIKSPRIIFHEHTDKFNKNIQSISINLV